MLSFLAGYDGSIEMFISILTYVLVFLFSLSCHEFAHGYAAYKNGDSTPYIDGRLTINPKAHLDLYGFLCCLFFGFGWAKPVRVNPLNYRNYKKGMIHVSLAGVSMNMILAFVGCGVYTLISSVAITNYFIYFLGVLGYYLFFLNISLAVFNLLPIHPLDGFMFLSTILKYDNKFIQFMHRYGQIILLVLLICFEWIIYYLISIFSIPLSMFWNFVLR